MIIIWKTNHKGSMKYIFIFYCSLKAKTIYLLRFINRKQRQVKFRVKNEREKKKEKRNTGLFAGCFPREIARSAWKSHLRGNSQAKSKVWNISLGARSNFFRKGKAQRRAVERNRSRDFHEYGCCLALQIGSVVAENQIAYRLTLFSPSSSFFLLSRNLRSRRKRLNDARLHV